MHAVLVHRSVKINTFRVLDDEKGVLLEKIGYAENARQENAGPDSKGGKCRTGKWGETTLYRTPCIPYVFSVLQYATIKKGKVCHTPIGD